MAANKTHVSTTPARTKFTNLNGLVRKIAEIEANGPPTDSRFRAPEAGWAGIASGAGPSGRPADGLTSEI